MNDERFPWLILVPKREKIREMHALQTRDQCALWSEILLASTALEAATAAYKMNVGALGNLVPQLHIHVIARRQDDSAWPNPVWGFGKPVPYQNEGADHFCKQFLEQCETLRMQNS